VIAKVPLYASSQSANFVHVSWMCISRTMAEAIAGLVVGIVVYNRKSLPILCVILLGVTCLDSPCPIRVLRHTGVSRA
jgi:hypothetical protein